MSIALPIIAAMGAMLLFLLATASANTELFASHYTLLFGVNALAALALLVLVGIQLRGLRREYKQRVFGSRIKARMVGMLAVMAVVPGVLVYGVSMQFAIKSIDSWFDVRVDTALEGGLDLGRQVLDALESDLLAKGREMALNLSDTPSAGPTLLNRLREQAGVQEATVLNSNGGVVANSSGETGALLPSLPSPALLRQAKQTRGVGSVDTDSRGNLILRALLPMTGQTIGNEPRILQLVQPVPPTIAKSAESVEAAHRDYQALQLGRVGLKRIYTMTLTFTLLVALFAAVALAFFLAERLARPLLILAEGTQAVAAGDFTPRAALATDDELGVLTQSFSAMTRQLNEARNEAERHQVYLESILANLSAGVLAFDAEFHLQAANRGAEAILADNDLGALGDRSLAEWPRHGVLAQAIVENFQNQGAEWQKQLALDGPEGVPQALLIRGSTLPGIAGSGYVVVFDDISQVISAQRSVAWGEVARRLAHEIKNPLTPIQLSAERLEHKLASRLNPEDSAMLSRSISTIVNQVEAMKQMVNDFRDYARTPPPNLAVVELNALLTEICGLYEENTDMLRLDLAPDLPAVRADSSQLRQVLHNLIKNAQESLLEHPPTNATPEITIMTRSEARRVVLTVRDNGPGFGAQVLARACEPYVTSKPRGTGLGLAIVKKVIDEHKGELRLANRKDGGAAITIMLPVAA